ncbi:MAG: xanthine dehydrogenase family protein subunit M [Bacteriovoracaceae bacterium]|nr:xanthine dehydrogenase family protein subunit M [Bacteriovoracaceae bacterium]
MEILSEYEYFRPKTIKEAIKLLSKKKDSVILAGGTDLCNMLKDGMKSPKAVIDIKHIKTLKTVKISGNTLTVGALVTFTDVTENDDICTWFPILAEASATVASGATRNRATVVGNIVTAVPSADSAAPLMAYDTVVVIEGPKGTRRVKLHKFFKGPRKTVVKKFEIVTSIEVTTPESNHAGIYLKHQRYQGEDLAQSAVAILAFKDKTFRIGLAAVGPTPLRAHLTEAFLNGKEITPTVIEEAKEIINSEISPISDIRSTADYRRLMVKIMLERGIVAALERLDGNGPDYFERLI